MSMNHSRIKRAHANTVVPAMGVSLLMTTALLIAYSPHFDGNDDTAILTMVSGVKRSADPHTVYQNIILGRLYVFLYRLAPQLAWYTLFQLVVLFLAGIAISWVIIRRMGLWRGVPVSAGTWLVYGYGSIPILQYTRTAGIITAAGIFLLFQTLEEFRSGARKRLGSVIGAGLMLVGSWLRFQQFGAECMVMCGIAVEVLILECRKRSGEARNWWRRSILIVSLAGAMILGTKFLDIQSYRSPEWQAYNSFNKVRTQLLDYGFPNPVDHAQAYQDAGINDLDLITLRSWNFADPNRFSTEKLQVLVNAKEPITLGTDEFLQSTVPGLLKQPECWWTLFLLFLLLIAQIRTRNFRGWLPPALAAIMFTGIQFGLTLTGRVLVSRVDIGLWFALCLSIAWAFPNSEPSRQWRYTVSSILALLAIAQGAAHIGNDSSVTAIPRFSRQAESYRKSQSNYREELLRISADKQHLYVAKVGALTVYKAYGPFDQIPRGLMSNIVYLGGWAAFTPGWTETLEAYGAANAFADLMGNDRLRLVDRNVEQTVEYLRAYYDPKTYVQQVGTTGGYGIYRVLAGGEE